MFILCDKMNIKDEFGYDFRVWTLGTAPKYYSQPIMINCSSAKSAMSYVNGYNSGRLSAGEKVIEVFKTQAFLDALHLEEKQ